MRTALRLALAALAIPVVARAGGTPEWAGRYMAEYSARAAGTANGAIPSFSRQTGLACNVCHIAFPQLTAFGRLFKLNAYTWTALPAVKTGDTGTSLQCSPRP